MKTSRVAKETARVAGLSSALASDISIPRRQTRSFAAAVQAFTAPGLKLGADIEDYPGRSSPASSTASRKRKRGVESPAISSATTPSRRSTRSSPAVTPTKHEAKQRRQPAKRVTNADGEVTVEPPTNWQEVYDTTLEMRKERNAPVDTMGCETLAEDHLSPRDRRFQTLIALMLSSQTKDTTNAVAMRRLQTELPHPGLTLPNILAVPADKLNDMIYVVGFHNNKTRYIKAAAEILRDKYAGDIPDSIEGLMSLPGVGPKMAYLCLSAAWGRTEGIGVDVHVHRITNLWGWHKTKTPEDTRLMLESWLPREKWHEINHLLVGFGQTICAPVGRKCGECLLSEKRLCPGATVDRRFAVMKKKLQQTVKMEDGIDAAEVKVEQERVVVVKQEDAPE